MATDLDYTNICGSGFQPYVADQIEKRKALVYNEQRTPNQLQWLNNKNVWIRVSSGTNVLPGNKDYEGLEGDALSKKYILQGGVLNHPNAETYALRYGVGEDSAYGLKSKSSNPAIPFNFGNVPMPGITNISVKTGGKLGTLKETTIDFVCYGMEQLSIMEALYMKLGFSLLVEWGHTFFIDNKTGKVETNVQPLPFYGIHSKEELMEKITEHRTMHSGNYDATWGTVKNFSYTLDGNGAFKCQVQLVGAGDVLESLKINVSGNFKNLTLPTSEVTSVDTGSSYPIIADANESLLNNALYEIYSFAGSTKGESSYAITTTDNPTYAFPLDFFFKTLNLSISNWSSNTELQKKGYNFRLINTPGMNAPHTEPIDNKVPEINPNPYFGKLSIDYESTEDEEKKEGSQQNYITLGHLFLLIMSTGMLYQWGETENETKQKPYVYIDINPDTNRCYTFPGHCSLDPSICLIGSDTLPFGITSAMFDDIKTNFPWGDDNGLGGRFMHTLVNLDFIASTMKKYRGADKKGDVNFVDLVKDILDGISKACGGYNEFRIVPDDDTRCVRIFDDRRSINGKITPPDYTEIPVLGYKSIVYNFSYTSKISPNTAAMVVVAAQAIPNGVQGAENALSFSHLNKGLINRLGAVTVDSGTSLNKEVAPGDNAESRYVELRDFIERIYDAVGTGALAATETETTTTQKNGFGDDLPPIIPKVNKDNFKDKFRGSLEAAIAELKFLAQNSKEDVSKELAALDNAKKAILISSVANDFENFKTLYQYDQKNFEEINIPKSSMYAYITLQLNANYDSPSSFYDDSAIEKLWQNKLAELNENKQNSDLK